MLAKLKGGLKGFDVVLARDPLRFSHAVWRGKQQLSTSLKGHNTQHGGHTGQFCST